MKQKNGGQTMKASLTFSLSPKFGFSELSQRPHEICSHLSVPAFSFPQKQSSEVDQLIYM